MSRIKAAILSVVGDRVATVAHVVEVRELSRRFRLIELESEAFASVTLGAIDKLKINVGDWAMRTYTPMRASASRLRVLALLHGRGPGSSWADSVSRGDSCQVMGPKRSLAVPTDMRLFLGDETSFATAVNLQRATSQPEARYLFEVSSRSEASEVLDALGLRGAITLERAQGDAHRSLLAAQASDALGDASSRAVLTGHAQSLQAVSSELKSRAVSGARLSIKPYWSSLRAGLD